MHPENPYFNRPPNFDALGDQYPSFQPFVSHDQAGKPYIDFKDPAALRELTRCLLKRDFSLDVVLPEDRLCPTLANRLDYIYHLLDIYSGMNIEDDSPELPLKALDIGTGATAIYAALLARIRKDARIWATELNEASFRSALNTLRRNQLFPPNVNLVKVENEDTPLLECIAAVNMQQGHQPFTFSLCNPPFYSSAEEMEESTASKAHPTYAAPTAADNELVTAGGEVTFIGRMIKESVHTRDRWYTSLVGKASSIPLLVNQLKEEKIDNYILLSIRQAHTTRWIIGWSFTDIRLPDSITRTPSPSTIKYLPPSNRWIYRPLERLLTHFTLSQLSEAVSRGLQDAGIQVDWQRTKSGISTAYRYEQARTDGVREGKYCNIAPSSISWTRAARRKRTQDLGAGESRSPLFHARIRVEELEEHDTRRAGSPDGDDRTGNTMGLQVSLDWRRGRDRAVVDGLWAYLVRKTADAVRAAGGPS